MTGDDRGAEMVTGLDAEVSAGVVVVAVVADLEGWKVEVDDGNVIEFDGFG